MGQLFRRLLKGDWFHFGNVPERELMKSDDEHYIGPEGRRHINPNVLVFLVKLTFPRWKGTLERKYFDDRPTDSKEKKE